MDRNEQLSERANAITHALGLVCSLVGVPILVVMASRHGESWHVVSCSIYGAALIVLYLASTLYHWVRNPPRKAVLRVIDHACIYLLIAGTYTPFTLVLLRGGWGWSLFGAVWGFAIAGIAFKVFFTGRFEFVSTALYIAMGWLALIAIKPVIERFPTGCLWLVAAGGMTYTAGVAFYALDRKPFMHAIWHIFVLGGSVFHYMAVILYVLPSDAWA